MRKQDILALEARLAAMEQSVAAPQPLRGLSFSSPSDGYALLGGLLLIGWVLGRRWQMGGR